MERGAQPRSQDVPLLVQRIFFFFVWMDIFVAFRGACALTVSILRSLGGFLPEALM